MNLLEAWIEEHKGEEYRTYSSAFRQYQQDYPSYPLSSSAFLRALKKQDKIRIYNCHYEKEANDWIEAYSGDKLSAASAYKAFCQYAKENDLAYRSYKSFSGKFHKVHNPLGCGNWEPEAIRWLHENAEMSPISVLLTRYNYQAARKKWQKRTRTSLIRIFRWLGYDPFDEHGYEDYTPTIISEYLGCTPTRIRRWIRSGKLRHKKIDGKMYVKSRDLYIFCTAHEMEITDFDPERSTVFLLDLMKRAALENRRKLLV